MDFLFNKTFGTLSGMLGFRSQKNKVIMSNIANMDTPGFKPKDYVFKSDLSKALDDQNSLALAKTDKKHLPAGQDEISDKNIAVNLYDDRESDTTVDASELISRAVAEDETRLVRADTYTAKNDITNYLIGVLFLLLLLEILIVRGRGEL